MIYEQLSGTSILSQEQLLQISELIYQTDPYIYPAIASEADFLRLLPYIIEKGDDNMFHQENLFIARQDHKIIGLVLWHKGSLLWDAIGFHQHAISCGVELKSTFPQADHEYFSTYAENTDAIQIINVCVASSHRGTGVGAHLMKAFMDTHSGERFELACLADNTVALKLYRRFGFHTLKECSGFSVSTHKPNCLILEKI